MNKYIFVVASFFLLVYVAFSGCNELGEINLSGITVHSWKIEKYDSWGSNVGTAPLRPSQSEILMITVKDIYLILEEHLDELNSLINVHKLEKLLRGQEEIKLRALDIGCQPETWTKNHLINKLLNSEFIEKKIKGLLIINPEGGTN